MVSPETKGTVCSAAKSQSASVSPGESHVTSAAGQSRVPHMAAAGGSWPRSWGTELPRPRSGEKGSHAAASLLHAAPPRTPDGRPGLSPALALMAETEPRSVLSVRCSRRGGTSHCSPSQGRNPRIAPAQQGSAQPPGRHTPMPNSLR